MTQNSAVTTALRLRRLTMTGYRYRGLARLSDKVRQHYSHKNLDIVIDDMDGDLRFYCEMKDHVTSRIFWRGHYSWDQIKLLKGLLRPEMVFMDIGANCGEFTVLAAKYLTQGQVIAFEPLPRHIARMRRNIELNGFKNVTVVEQGLSDHNGTAPMYLEIMGAAENENDVFDTMFPHGPDRKQVGTINLTTLDAYLAAHPVKRLDIVKIDIDGAEMLALSGARETLEKFKPLVFIELCTTTSAAAGYEADDIVTFLLNMNYKLYSINPDSSLKTFDPARMKTFQNILCSPALLPGVS